MASNPIIPPSVTAYLSAIGKKGGSATGKRKARSPEFYKRIGAMGGKAKKKPAP